MLSFLCTVSTAVVIAICIQNGAAQCQQCKIGADDDACNKANTTFVYNITQDDSYCKTLKTDSKKVSTLCKSYPKGYKVLCSKTNITCEDKCSAAMATGMTHLIPVFLAAIVLIYIVG